MESSDTAAFAVRVEGLVQGVGFRPYVWHLALSCHLSGSVRNDAKGVAITIAGAGCAAFLARLPLEIPPLARVDRIQATPLDRSLVDTKRGFVILESLKGQGRTQIGADTAVCRDCLSDIFDSKNRRFRYALTNCTHCGPRYTVCAGLPYDRLQTSLSPFPLCALCQAEYTDPANRRFHAETTVCPDCGPCVNFVDKNGTPLEGDPIAAALSFLQAGKIIAIKGLGGFHLACDARNARAVARLRQRKNREAKPFAVMVANVASAKEIADIDLHAAALLESRAAPIVLCKKGAQELVGIAPKLNEMGLMLPATPLQWLLLHEAAGQPVGTAWCEKTQKSLWVMTSANPSGMPVITDNAAALLSLAHIADAFLWHERAILARADDSVLRPFYPFCAEIEKPPTFQFIRRARGFVPDPIVLSKSHAAAPPVLALGAHAKNTACLLRGTDAFFTPHIGTLDNSETLDFLEESVSHLCDLLQTHPAIIAHDAHPDFPSTHLAKKLAEKWQIPTFAVAHHHAHLAALFAEHRLETPLIGWAIDGMGLGSNGGLWGGELLYVGAGKKALNCERLGSFRPLPLPGGDKAAREPWRMAVSALFDLGWEESRVAALLKKRFPQKDFSALQALWQMLEKNVRCPKSSSAGRLFDAAAALLGVCADSAYEGQAAMQLESLAANFLPQRDLPLVSTIFLQQAASQPFLIDTRALLSHLAKCDDPVLGAAIFHRNLAHCLADGLIKAKAADTDAIFGVSGGVAQNALLMRFLREDLAQCNTVLIEAEKAPANDGGLALGQAFLARLFLQSS